MDIAWIGHAAFRLRGRDAAVVLDPCPSSTGFRLGRPQADIVTISNPAPEHAWHQGVGGEPANLDAPGEYEIHNVLVTGVVTNRPALARPAPDPDQRDDGDEPDEPPTPPTTPVIRNLGFVVTIDEVVVAHLGDLRGEPSPQAMEELSRADVLLIPVGGNGRLDAKTAVKVAGAIDARLVIPMLYKVGPETALLDPVDAFLSAIGAVAPETLDNHVNVTSGGLGPHTVVQVLAPRGV